jgi:hypothetical protein
MFVSQVEEMTRESAEKNGNAHLLGGPFYAIWNPDGTVQLAKYNRWPSDTSEPTFENITLSQEELTMFKSYMHEIQRRMPESEDIIPCHLKDDHMNQIGYYTCTECTPFPDLEV